MAKSLKPNSIDSWEALKWVFIDNFQGAIIPKGTKHNLSQVKWERGESLRSYMHRFFETRATITEISNKDTIRCFRNGLHVKMTY